MKRFHALLLAPLVFAIYAMAPADSAVIFPTPGTIAALIENANASGVFECGGFDTCGGGHEIVTTSDDGSYQTHDCWPGTIHSGPKCTAMLVPLEQLMDTPTNEVADLVAWNPHVRANRALERIETYDCDGDLYSMASYEVLGISESDLN